MNVMQLMAQLSCYSDHTEVIISKDEEGNGYLPVAAVEECLTQEDGYEISVIAEEDYEDYETCTDTKLRVVIWP